MNEIKILDAAAEAMYREAQVLKHSLSPQNRSYLDGKISGMQFAIELLKMLSVNTPNL